MFNLGSGLAVRWTLVALLAGGCVGGCCCCPNPNHPVTTMADLAGTWRGPFGGTLTLRADGTFARDQVVWCGESDQVPGPVALTDSGNWTLAAAEFFDDSQQVLLGSRQQLSISDKGELYSYVGDVDDPGTCRFRRGTD